MSKTFIDKLPLELKNFYVKKIAREASTKIIYKIFLNKKSFIGIDFNKNEYEYKQFIYIYNILSKIDISIPEIIYKDQSNLLLVCEDFGELRYDKILRNYSIKNLLKYSLDTLLVMNKNILFDNSIEIPLYNKNIFINEIKELPLFYFEFIKLKDNKNLLEEEFLNIWLDLYNLIDFEFNKFCHKDFNLNNLLYLPERKNHLKCGVIDFQSAFWGESCWDLFSFLEDSRIDYSNQFNEEMIEYFYKNTYQKISLKSYTFKYHFLNCSRQTRLLGRWIKLSRELNNKSYLNFIPITKKRLESSLSLLKNDKLSNFYNKYIF